MTADGEEGRRKGSQSLRIASEPPLVVKGSKPLFCIIYHVIPCRRSEEVCGSLSGRRKKQAQCSQNSLIFPDGAGRGGTRRDYEWRRLVRQGSPKLGEMT